MTVPLLPEPKDKKDAWPAKEGFFSLNADDVRRRLALSEHLAPEGVASPLAQLHYLTWRLEAQTEAPGAEAATALRLTVLLQYLGHLAPTVIPLDSSTDLGWLAPVLARWWATEEVKRLVVWKIRGLGAAWDGQVFAGSHRMCPLFPGAIFYPDRVGPDENRKPRWQQVRDALVAARGPATKGGVLDRVGGVASPVLAAGLARYLNRFITAAGNEKRGWVVAFETWRNQLLAVAGGAQAPADSVLPAGISVAADAEVSFGLYPGTSLVDAWTCAQCRAVGESWTNTAGTQTVVAKRTQVSCTRHKELLRRGSQPVGPADYGAHAAPDGVLYVWTEAQAQPPGCTRAMVNGQPGRDGTVTYWFNEQEVTIQGKLVSLDAVLLPTVAWMVRAPGEVAKPIDVPVSGAYVGLVESCETDELNRQWTIQFHGLREPVDVTFCAEADLWKQSAIVVWPPEERAGWTLDYVAASTGGAQAAGFRLIEKAADGPFVRSPVCRIETLYRTERGILRYVEVGRIVSSGDGFESLGLLAVRRPTLADPDVATQGTIALDFGTSNSAVCWQVSGAVVNAYGFSGEDPARPARFLSFDADDIVSLLAGVDVLAPWNRKEKPPRPFIPSLHAMPKQRGSQPTVPPRGQGLDLLADPGTEPRILSGLKWRDWQAPGIRQRVQDLLELALLPAAWALRREGCKSAKLTASYPLAFEREKQNTYRGILTTIVGDLKARTGLAIDPASIDLVSESAAGSSYLPKISATHVVALDLGGGTTDVVVHVGAGGTDFLRKPENTVLAADSLEYAGRDFLRAVVVSLGAAYIHEALPHIDPALTPPDPARCKNAEELFEAYVASLEALIHRHQVAGLLKLMREPIQGVNAAELNLKYSQVIMRWEALLAGLMLYARRIAEGCVAEAPADSPLRISFSLFGMGWDLLRILIGDLDRHVSYSLDSRFQAMGVEMSRGRTAAVSIDTHALPPMPEPKITVVDGALKLSAEGRGATDTRVPVHALMANVRQTFVGMNLYERAPKENPAGQSEGPPHEEEKIVLSATIRLENATKRPATVADPGYAHLVEDLFNSIPEFIDGTNHPLRGLVRKMLMESSVYKRESPDISKHLVDLGQDNFNRYGWPSASPHPQLNLLAGFLSGVWRPLWSATKL